MAQKYMSKYDDRVGYLAALSLAQVGNNADWKLSSVCRQYYEKFKAKPFCFEDLRKHINALDPQERDAFLEIVANDESAENSEQSLLVMKMKYCFQFGPQAKREELEQFAKAALDLYNACRRKSKACPEAGFLAAVALVKIAQSQVQPEAAGKRTRYDVLLQAAMLLESCQKDQKHGEEYYPYLILLIRVQQMLGLMSMAMMNFKKLSVKNIQHESVGYLLLNRISTLHPRQFGKITPSHDHGYSPLEQLDLALEMLEHSELTLTRQINTGLDYGSYSNIAEAIQMRANLQRSINREVFAYEHLKTRRLTGLLDEGGHPVPDYLLVDQRDFFFLQTYEVSGQSPIQYLEMGPLPKEKWLDAMSLYDKLFFYLRTEFQGQSGMSEKALSLLKAALEIFDESSYGEVGSELTEAEAENLAIHQTLATLLVQPPDFIASRQQHTDECLDRLEGWLKGKSTEPPSGWVTIHDISAPAWEYLHASFTTLETIQGILLFLSTAGKKNSKVAKTLSVPKETISKLQSLVTAAEAVVHKQAKDIKTTLNEAGVLGKLVDLVTGRSEAGDQDDGIGLAIESMGDAARLETFCGEMKESWEDAVDGILACKMKVFK
jgi:N-terminal acetyltransferase B complex non-catalytic subunit